MIRNARGVPAPRWATADAGYGDNPTFLKGLDDRQVAYVGVSSTFGRPPDGMRTAALVLPSRPHGRGQLQEAAPAAASEARAVLEALPGGPLAVLSAVGARRDVVLRKQFVARCTTAMVAQFSTSHPRVRGGYAGRGAGCSASAPCRANAATSKLHNLGGTYNCQVDTPATWDGRTGLQPLAHEQPYETQGRGGPRPSDQAGATLDALTLVMLAIALGAQVDAHRHGGIFFLWGAPRRPRLGPSPGTPVALPRCGYYGIITTNQGIRTSAPGESKSVLPYAGPANRVVLTALHILTTSGGRSRCAISFWLQPLATSMPYARNTGWMLRQ